MTHRSESLLPAPRAQNAGEIARELVATQYERDKAENHEHQNEERERQQMYAWVGQDQGESREIRHGLLRHLPVPGVDEENDATTSTDHECAGTFGSHPTGRREHVASSRLSAIDAARTWAFAVDLAQVPMGAAA